MKQKLRLVAEQIIISHANLGLLRGRMGHALYLYQYTRHIDQRYEAYADKYIDEIIEGTEEMSTNYIDGLSGIGVGFECLAREGFLDVNTNELLGDLDKLIHRVLPASLGFIDARKGMIGYGKYYLSRLNNLSNKLGENFELVELHLFEIVESLSVGYFTYEDICFVIDLLPNIISLGINQEKSVKYFNYAIDLLETMVYEDEFFGKYPSTFNPLIVAVFLFRSSKKLNNRSLADKALLVLERYELGFRIFLSDYQAVKWSFLYHLLWIYSCRDVYQKLSIEWLKKVAKERTDLENADLTMSGLMLLSINGSINDDWLDWFPLI